MRIKPDIMLTQDKVKPYGVFFVHGRRFNGFHVRFRDIARGGLRVVSPPSSEQHALESAKQFDEVCQRANIFRSDSHEKHVVFRLTTSRSPSS